jgi:preprotein translocase subunit SecA
MQMAGLSQSYYERADAREIWLDGALHRARAHTLRASAPLRRRRLTTLADDVVALGPSISILSDAALLDAASALRARMVSAGRTRESAIRAFALAREACARQLGLRHYPVQLMGGAAMLSRSIAEMETGEGKTITAVLPAATLALSGLPVHIVTVNDYLAERDSTHLRPVYEALGLTVGLVVHGQSPRERREAYSADVTYCTNKDLVFDYLRDRLTLGRLRARSRQVVQALTGVHDRTSEPLLLRGLHAAIVDEADSVLIDEACTPLILAGPASGGQTADEALYADALAVARTLARGAHWRLDPKERSAELTDDGRAELHLHCAGRSGLWASRRAREELAERALSALHLFHRDVQYIVSDGKVQIVDEFTGRVMQDRSWEFGLHQMIEAKEGVEVTDRKQTLARITFQRFFRRYGHLSGMTGTVAEVAGEIAAVYHLDTIRIPTNRPSRRARSATNMFLSSDDKWAAVVDSARARIAIGQSVLIGTRSVEASEKLGEMLQHASLQHTLLNARNDRNEAEIVASAGQPGRITVATNMAGRGTDIRLSREVADAGGLHVILTEFHEARRIDRQFFGRGGRQGDPGGYECFASLEDEIPRRFGPGLLRWVCRSAAVSALSVVPVPLAWLLVCWAQSNASRVSARMRRTVLTSDFNLDRLLAFAGPRE